jgi:D-amino-acid dehydrogenase
MKITILGAGLLDVCSAFFLRRDGYDVEVIDRQPDVARETSYANGGQISVCYSEPWSSFDNLKKIITWVGKEDSPILFKPQLDFRQWLWSLNFLYQCLPYRNKDNIKEMLKIALYSRKTLQELRAELNLSYAQQTNGILTFYSSQKSFEHGIEASLFMSKFGCDRIIKTKEETLSIEPSLKYASFNIFGSDYSPDDESGDAKIFTEEMKIICESMGVRFFFNHEILEKKNLISNGNLSRITALDLKINKEVDFISEKYLVCLGSYSPLFLKHLAYLPIYPAKGYSATYEITNSHVINNISLTDMDKKIVLTRIGNYLRVAGTAEFNGYDLTLNEKRCLALTKRVKEIHPHGLDYENIKYWTGLRPATPGNVPIIRQIKNSNVFINSGHGTLGWTMAAGSGKLISQIINKKKTFG